MEAFKVKQKRHTAEQVVMKLREAEAGLGAGMSLGQVLQKLGVSEQTYYRWKKKYGGMELSEAKRLKGLEEENRRLKKLVADQALDIQILKEVAEGNF